MNLMDAVFGADTPSLKAFQEEGLAVLYEIGMGIWLFDRLFDRSSYIFTIS